MNKSGDDSGGGVTGDSPDGKGGGEYTLRVFAVRTAGRREKSVAGKISSLSRQMGFGVEEVHFHPTTRGYVYVVCRNLAELEEIVKRIPDARQIVGEIPPEEARAFLSSPVKEEGKTGIEIREYDTVVIDQGPEAGSVGVVEKIEGKNAVVLINDGLMPRRVEVPVGFLSRK
ncbi:MAG: hypothetical protein J7L61_04265 [Thermoplasmata archaeon]|nr:hypothetical protein [Thermoplasmata archaeon]